MQKKINKLFKEQKETNNTMYIRYHTGNGIGQGEMLIKMLDFFPCKPKQLTIVLDTIQLEEKDKALKHLNKLKNFMQNKVEELQDIQDRKIISKVKKFKTAIKRIDIRIRKIS